MQPSRELIDLVLSVADRSCSLLFNTDGPLKPSIIVETTSGERRVVACAGVPKPQELVAAASSGGVLRLVVVMTGMLRGAGPTQTQTPALLMNAFERGDVAGFQLVQRFASGTEPRFLQIEGKVEIVRRQESVFRHASFALSSDRDATEGWLQASFSRFARRMAAAAAGDATAEARDVSMALVAGQDRAAGSFCFRHADGVDVRCEVDYRDNTFVPTRLAQLADGEFVPIEQQRGQEILQKLVG